MNGPRSSGEGQRQNEKRAADHCLRKPSRASDDDVSSHIVSVVYPAFVRVRPVSSGIPLGRISVRCGPLDLLAGQRMTRSGQRDQQQPCDESKSGVHLPILDPQTIPGRWKCFPPEKRCAASGVLMRMRLSSAPGSGVMDRAFWFHASETNVRSRRLWRNGRSWSRSRRSQ